jgi:NAD(P)-dependent dehydrogenase (short-subunit alcohol dehydrogenase family)
MKAAVVTGVSSGLGKAIALDLLRYGWVVFGISRSSADEDLKKYPSYIDVQKDIRDAQSMQDFFENMQILYGVKSISLLVNNAGVFNNRIFEDTDISKIDSIIDTNVKGTMYVTKYALDVLEENSRIIFINSVAGLSELVGQSVYCASKAALTAFAGVIGAESRHRGVKVTSIHPGGINTPLWNRHNPYPPNPANPSLALDTKEITDMIQLILSSNAEFKTIKLFPSIEWH